MVMLPLVGFVRVNPIGLRNVLTEVVVRDGKKIRLLFTTRKVHWW